MANRNRTAGHNWERELVIRLKTIWPSVVTSRSNSSTRDAEKVDLMNKDEWQEGRMPLDFQAKCAASLNIEKLMGDAPRRNRYVILHKKVKKVNKRFLPVGQYAYMKMDTLLIGLRYIKMLLTKVNRLSEQLRIERLKTKALEDELNCHHRKHSAKAGMD